MQAFAGDFHHRSKQLQGYRSACARLVSEIGKCDGGVMSGAVGGGGGGGAGAVVRQGHLRKLKTMKKKFFVLRAETAECGARLDYYESEKKFRAGAAPRRVLPLKSCYNITRRLDLKQKHVIALFTREEQFCVVAENEQDLHAWLSALLKQHHSDDASEELLHPIQHVWQVNVQKKGLGAVKNIHGLYNLCLTDKTLSLVKIKSHNNVISELGIPERVEYSLKNIRRCGDSECFFYMEVGRQTTTGAGELWMHSDDSNIAQSMHSTIYHAMRNCAKESENERDHIVIPKNEGAPPARRQTYSDGRGRAGLTNEKGLCVGACIRQCVCASGTLSEESSAALAPLSPHAEYQPNNTLTDKPEGARVIKHHRTVSLPTGCPLFQEPLKIVHERTRSAPLTGEEVDRVVEKALHSSCKPLNGTDLPKKSQCRRASTGMRLSKLSPAHSKNAGTLRNRCDSMPSRACSSFEIERPPIRHNDLEGMEVSRDEADAVAEWYRTPRIPEEPDVCDISKDLINMSLRAGSSIQHSRTSSLGVEEAEADLSTLAHEPPDGYLPMAPGLVSASSGSVCSGTPSTDPRFSEYQLEPATSHITPDTRPPRAYSVGSRPAPRAEARHRAYSVGARARPPAAPAPAPAAQPRARAEHDDLMLLDFSNNSPANKAITPCPCPPAVISRTPPTTALGRAPVAEEYVDMSPLGAGYVEMRPGELPAPRDGYVEMSYGRTRPIAIAAPRPRAAPAPPAPDADDRFRRKLESRTPHGSQIFEFSGSLESPMSPADVAELDDDSHHLATVRETSEDAPRPALECKRVELRDSVRSENVAIRAEAVSCSPQYVTLKSENDPPVENNGEWLGGAAVVVAGAGVVVAPARFAVSGGPPSPSPAPAPAPGPFCPPLNYAALDLEPRRAPAHPAARTYTQIDFVRSEKLHAADGT